MAKYKYILLVFLLVLAMAGPSCGNEDDEPVLCQASDEELNKEIADLITDVNQKLMVFAIESNLGNCLAAAAANDRFLARVTELEMCFSEEEYESFSYQIQLARQMNDETACEGYR